eukprot:scaffold14_cov380-Prasinococcus_capsulatus_cf.AAC.8
MPVPGGRCRGQLRRRMGSRGLRPSRGQAAERGRWGAAPPAVLLPSKTRGAPPHRPSILSAAVTPPGALSPRTACYDPAAAAAPWPATAGPILARATPDYDDTSHSVVAAGAAFRYILSGPYTPDGSLASILWTGGSPRRGPRQASAPVAVFSPFPARDSPPPPPPGWRPHPVAPGGPRVDEDNYLLNSTLNKHNNRCDFPRDPRRAEPDRLRGAEGRGGEAGGVERAKRRADPPEGQRRLFWRTFADMRRPTPSPSTARRHRLRLPDPTSASPTTSSSASSGGRIDIGRSGDAQASSSSLAAVPLALGTKEWTRASRAGANRSSRAPPRDARRRAAEVERAPLSARNVWPAGVPGGGSSGVHLARDSRCLCPQHCGPRRHQSADRGASTRRAQWRRRRARSPPVAAASSQSRTCTLLYIMLL